MKISWVSLNSIGSSKIVNTSFIWLALIPFLSRTLDAMYAAGTPVPQLPLNFILFYYAAFSFSIAALVFHFACPDLVKSAPTFGAFKAGGFSTLELKIWLLRLAPRPDIHKPDWQAWNHFLHELGRPDPKPGPVFVAREGSDFLMRQSLWESDPKAEELHLPDAHNALRLVAERTNKKLRIVAAFFYALGFLFFALVAVLNLIVVARRTVAGLSEVFG